MANGSINLRQLTQSQQTLRALQSQFGTLQLGRFQAIRRQFYSYVQYGTGSTQFNFFGSAVGNAGQNRQLTNMPLAGSFGTSHFLLKAIRTKYFVNANLTPASYTGVDADAGLFADFVNGFAQAGELEFNVNAKNFVQIIKPFLNAPPADGRIDFLSAGQVDANTDQYPYAELNRRSENIYLVDPELFIAAQQNFSCNIAYPSGAIAPRGGGFSAALSTALFIGISLDGIEFRPVQ